MSLGTGIHQIKREAYDLTAMQGHLANAEGRCSGCALAPVGRRVVRKA